jgi:hypothetical protein
MFWSVVSCLCAFRLCTIPETTFDYSLLAARLLERPLGTPNASLVITTVTQCRNGGHMENRDPAQKYPRCDDEEEAQYLGNRDQIECILGSCSMTAVEKRSRDQISLQPQGQINAVLEETK